MSNTVEKIFSYIVEYDIVFNQIRIAWCYYLRIYYQSDSRHCDYYEFNF